MLNLLYPEIYIIVNNVIPNHKNIRIKTQDVNDGSSLNLKKNYSKNICLNTF